MKSNTMLKVAPDDRRIALRQISKEVVFNLTSKDGSISKIRLEDVSRTGLRFNSREHFQCGETVTICPCDLFDLAPCQAIIARIELIQEADGAQSFAYGAKLTNADAHRHAWFLSLRSN